MTRRGGIAGVPMVADVDTAELDPAAAARADEALDRMRSAAGERSAPAGADRFRFELSLPDAPGAPGDLVVDETDVPDGLRPVLDLAASRAQPA